MGNADSLSVRLPRHSERRMASLVLEDRHPHDIRRLPVHHEERKVTQTNAPKRGTSLAEPVLPRTGLNGLQTLPPKTVLR